MSIDPKQQPAGRYMDVTHPAHVRPSPTSKPVIIGNRPMLVDPMIAESAERAVTAHKTDENSPLVASSTESHTKNVEPPAGLATAPGLPRNHEEVGKQETQNAELVVAEAPAAPPDSEDTTNPELSSTPTAEIEEATELHKEAVEIHETPTTNAAVTATSAIDTSADSDAPETKDEATVRNEQIIVDGTYFLPIGQTKHRGQRIVFGLCLIIVLALVVLDVLLDVGIISLAVPHTTFFSS